MSRYNPSTYAELIQREISAGDFLRASGETDDTGRLQRLFASLKGGETVYFPAGNYTKNAGLQLTVSNVQLVFAKGAKITDSTNVNGIEIAAGISNILLDGVALYGAANGTNGNTNGITIDSTTTDVTLRDCYISGYNFGVIASSQNARINIDNCKFYNMYYVASQSTGGYGVILQSATYCKATNCYFDSSVYRHSIYCGRDPNNLTYTGYGHIFANNIFLGADASSYTTGTEYRLKIMGNQDVTVVGNNFSGGAGHILLVSDGSTNPDPDKITITGNTFTDVQAGTSNYAAAIYASGTGTNVMNVVISDNVFKDMTASIGAVCITHGTNILIADNVFSNLNMNTAALNPSGAAVSTELGVTRLIIKGNIMSSPTNNARAVYVGTQYASGDESSELYIGQNSIDGFQFGLYLVGVSDGIIENNRIVSAQYQCIYFASSVAFVGQIRNNTLENGNDGISFNAQTTGRVHVYGNVFSGIGNVSVDNSAGSTILVEPILNSHAASNSNNVRTAGTAAPTAGTWIVGDECINTVPTVTGSAGSQYVVEKWKCTNGGAPGTWTPFRTLTGT